MSLWQCPDVAVSGGLFTKWPMLALGLFFMTMSLMRGLRVGPALSRRPGVPAGRIHRFLFLIIGAVTAFQALRLLLLCVQRKILKHFEQLNTKPPPPDIEGLKRAGLIMAMTAWETYVEDRVTAAAEFRLRSVGDESIAELVRSKLREEIGRLHNPTSEKTFELFRSYAAVDLKNRWCWNGSDAETNCRRAEGLRIAAEVRPDLTTDRQIP